MSPPSRRLPALSAFVPALRVALLAALLGLGAQAAGAAEAWERFFTRSLGDYRAELADARAAGKKGVMFVYQQDPCPYCERMRAKILSRPDVQKWYGARFAAYSIDVRGSVEMQDFAGRSTTESRYARDALVRGDSDAAWQLSAQALEAGRDYVEVRQFLGFIARCVFPFTA